MSPALMETLFSAPPTQLRSVAGDSDVEAFVVVAVVEVKAVTKKAMLTEERRAAMEITRRLEVKDEVALAATVLVMSAVVGHESPRILVMTSPITMRMLEVTNRHEDVADHSVVVDSVGAEGHSVVDLEVVTEVAEEVVVTTKAAVAVDSEAVDAAVAEAAVATKVERAVLRSHLRVKCATTLFREHFFQQFRSTHLLLSLF